MLSLINQSLYIAKTIIIHLKSVSYFTVNMHVWTNKKLWLPKKKKKAVAIIWWINTSIMKSSRGKDNSIFFLCTNQMIYIGIYNMWVKIDYHKNFLASVKKRHREKRKRGKNSYWNYIIKNRSWYLQQIMQNLFILSYTLGEGQELRTK